MRIKNWKRFQHYQSGKRSIGTPEWIKLYHKLLDDPEWFFLSDSASRLLVECWMMASENNGELPPLKTIAFRLRKKVEEIEKLISELDHWLDGDASTMLADGYHSDSAEEKRGEEKREENKYRFSGTVLRLTQKDYDTWKASFTTIDLDAYLVARDAFLASLEPGDQRRKGGGFMSSATDIRNKHEQARAKLKPRIVVGPRFKPEPVVKLPSLEERQAQVERVLKRRAKIAVVRGDDEGEEGTSSELKSQEAGVRDVLPALQAMDYS